MASLELLNQIAEVLNVPNNGTWEITDNIPEENLVCVHHTEVVNLEKYSWIKGIIIDTQNNEIVCSSFPSSLQVSLNMDRDIVPMMGRTSPVPSYRFLSLDGQDLSIPVAQSTWVKGYDGALVRVWMHQRTSKIYISSHKKIQTDKSWNSWGGSKPFTELYHSLGGPTETLFPKDDPLSHLNVFTFMILDPRLQTGSRLQLSEPKLLYLGTHVLKNKEGLTPQDTPSHVLASVARPEELSLPEVHQFLRYGYFPPEPTPPVDPRATAGEFVMLFVHDQNNKSIASCIKVMSRAYHWRVQMRSNNPDLRNLTFSLASLKARDLTTRVGKSAYDNRYLLLAMPEESDLPYVVPRFIPEEEIIAHQRETAVASLVFSVPPHEQREVLQHYAEYLEFLPKCVRWIMTLWLDPAPQAVFDRIVAQNPYHGNHVVRRIKNMIQVSTQHHQNQGLSEEEYKRRFEQNIKLFCESEFGDSMNKFWLVYQTL
jgi:hypothetical protein